MKEVVIVRGAGDLASGIIYKLFKCGYHVIATDIEKPTSIRREVSFSEAIYQGETMVEDVKAVHSTIEESIRRSDVVNVVVDPNLEILNIVKPIALVDAILAKRNLGTTIDMAPTVIGIGPGFAATRDCHAVIESARGHDLGRVINVGFAKPNTGIPGVVGGQDRDRVFHAVKSGKLKEFALIGDIVEEGHKVLEIDGTPMNAPFTGVIRGILPSGFMVKEGMKIADIDPRLTEVKNCYTISDKARTIAGGVIEVIMNRRGKTNE